MRPTNDDRKTAPRWGLIAVGGLALLILGFTLGRMGRPQPLADADSPAGVTGTKSDGEKNAGGVSFLPDRHETGASFQEKSAAETDEPRGFANALRIPLASLREAALLQEGFAMAKIDIGSAFHAMGSIEEPGDREAVLRGIFSYVADAESLPETLEWAKLLLDESDRSAALFATLDSLTGSSQETQDRARGFVERFGIEAGIGMALTLDPVYRPEHGDAWIATFGDSDGKAAMIGSFAALRVMEDPDGAMAMGEGLTDWDREVFLLTISGYWPDREPAKAWEWARQLVHDSEPAGAKVVGNVLRNWARKDFEAANLAFRQLTDPEQRKIAAHGIAQSLANQSGTAAAVNWANQLPTEAEKDAAHAAIADHSPQGIGVALELKNGFAVINKVIAQGAAARNGQLQQGDRIVGVDPGSGKFQNLYGRDLTQALTLIRGDSGSQLRLRVVRQDEQGNFRDRVVELTREQIVREGS